MCQESLAGYLLNVPLQQQQIVYSLSIIIFNSPYSVFHGNYPIRFEEVRSSEAADMMEILFGCN